MMRITEIIIEAIAAPVLYHGTKVDNIPRILNSGAISPSANGRTSASRDRKRVETSYGEEAYFVLDQRKIANRQHITPVDWKYGANIVKDTEPFDPGALSDREDSEESIKGPVKLNSVLELVLNVTPTPGEEMIEQDIEQHPEHLEFVQGMRYSDRMNEYKQYAKQFAKLGIKTTFKKY